MPVIPGNLIDRLIDHKTLGGAPRSELEWLIAHGSIQYLKVGEVLNAKGRQVEALYILLAGRLALFVDRGSGPNKLIEWQAGSVTGMLPYSRLGAPPGDVCALEATEILTIPREHFKAMTQECFEVTSILVHTMLDRTRLFTSTELHNEKMISLGKLSGGLAHELNNPASAIERSAAILHDRLEDREVAALYLAAAELSEVQLAAIDEVRRYCLVKPECGTRAPLEQSDREEAIEDWLTSNGLDAANAQMLADTEVPFESLDLLLHSMDKPTANAAIRWTASGSAMRNLTERIQESATRISSLVNAVKGFTHMDQANAAEPVDLGPSLANTVAVLQAKAHEKSVFVTLQLQAELPKVHGFAGELNQVWGNLIENALDAVGNGGRVEVIALREDHRVVVQILDDGPGIPEKIRDRVFDPFFTTKAMGEGTGLGLDIARRLVLHNDGAIDFESQPGRTEFRVRLPIAEGSLA